ncbi:hypothetical protein F7725_021400 [Dissostichus mawsoni]|uniref:Uncharacterized protein n=1 Tax=Dissostichus mawsoni TaxID=36200 RepID=A0A7J5ZCY8_DISMA|nr:hypothetical protein F7725_021400 [Dissostichus mawsoni]
MLVEKQKVIEELTWKLHQEQRQVEELRMQLHRRKRCYRASLDTIPPTPHPPMLHQRTPAITSLGDNQAGAHVPVPQLPSVLPQTAEVLSSQQLHGGCRTLQQTPLQHEGPGGPPCMDATSGSPPTMSAFLSPQCSPQDSPLESLLAPSLRLLTTHTC